MLFLLRCRFWKSEPSRGPPSAVLPSTASGSSILMALAPQSASWRTHVGPARTRVRSSTVKRERGRGPLLAVMVSPYTAVMPPSMTSSAPVTNDASSEARNSAP